MEAAGRVGPLGWQVGLATYGTPCTNTLAIHPFLLLPM